MDDSAQVGRIVAAVRRADPGLDEAAVRAVVLAVAASPSARLQLARELSAQPAVLTSARGGRHAVTQRLIMALAETGSGAVSRPHCILCRRTRDLPMALPGGGRACSACQDLLLADRCPGCSRWRRLRARLPDSRPACPDCARQARRQLRPRPQPPSSRLRSRRPWRLYGDPERNDQIRTGWVVAAVHAVDPALSADTVRAALSRVAPSRIARGWIAREVLARPEVLTSGGLDSRQGTQRLVAELVRAGSTGLRQPPCPRCSRMVALPSPLPGGAGRVCSRCARWLAAGPCPGCGGHKQLRHRLVDGTRACRRCANADPARWEACHRCGQLRPVAGRTAEGPYCGQCQPDADLPCAECGRTEVTRRRCADVMLCSRCGVAPRVICAGCGTIRRLERPDSGCPACPATECARCPGCGEVRVGHGPGVTCYRCRLHRRLARLVDGAHPDRVEQLQPFLDGLRATVDPRRGLDWLYRGRVGQHLVADMLHGRAPLDHATLDAVNAARTTRSTAVEHLRFLLVASGVLPARDEHLHRLEQHVDRLLTGSDPAVAGLLRQWAVWHVLPRVRRRIAAGKPSLSASGTGRTAVVTVHHFLHDLHGQGTLPTGLSQAHVDAWCSRHLQQRAVLATFLSWAGRRGHTPSGLQVPPEADRTPRLITGQENLYAAARRCLTDDTLPTGHRLAASLVLIYGQPLVRICTLQTADLQLTADGLTTLRLGSTPVTLLPPLDEIAHHVAATAAQQVSRTGVSTGFTTRPIWLFPGLPLTKHVNPTVLSDQLATLISGNVRGHRNTALLTLAREVPPAVLADLLGLHPGTVEHWRQLAGGSLATYTAARLANAVKGQV